MSDLLEAPWRLDILLVAADPNQEGLLRTHLAQGRQGRFRVTAVPHLDEAITELRRWPYDLLLISLCSFEPGAAALFLRIRGLAPRIAIVVVARGVDEETAYQAVQAGVQDVLAPDALSPQSLASTLRHAQARQHLVAELRRAGQAGSSKSFFDSVTGLASRTAFIRRLEEKLAMACRLGEHPGVLLAGLEGLSRLRESLGPLQSSRVLQETGRRLLWCVRRCDMTARLGGERFAVLLPHVKDLPSVHLVAERIRTTLSEPMENHPSRPALTASIGIACHPQDGSTAETLLHQAEFALARARARGGSCSCFSHNLSLLLRPQVAAAEEERASGSR